MSQIEDQLRDALANAPMPATSTADPLSDLQRRIGRARWRVGAIAVAGVVAVVTAIIVPIALLASTDHTVSPVTHQHVEKLPTHFGGAVTSGGGYVWSLRQDFNHSHAANGANDGIVAKRAPGTLRVLDTYRVPGPVDFIAYGLNRLWVWGGGDGGYPNARLSVVNLSNRHVTTVPFGHGRPLTDLLFESGNAWALGELPSQVVRINVHGNQVAFGRTFPAPSATGLVAGNGVIYALAAPVSTPSGPQDTVATVNARTGNAIGAARPDGHLAVVLPTGFLVVRGGHLVSEDELGAVIGSVLPYRVRYVSVAEDSARGIVYVATVGGSCINGGCERLLEYSLADLEHGTAKPLAAAPLRPRGELFSMVVDPSGSLLLTNGQSAFRWTPTP